MLHYESPSRDVCPNEGQHAQIEARRRPGNRPVNPHTIVGETPSQKTKRIKDQKKEAQKRDKRRKK